MVRDPEEECAFMLMAICKLGFFVVILRYDGNWKAGKKEGKGKLTYTSRAVYIGD